MERCNHCIIPDTVPGVTFNEYGICNYCQDKKNIKPKGKKELDEVIEKIKNRNKRYDCLVPLSGGRDSTYVLYLAKSIYNLKVLAVNNNNEFQTKQAINNMKKACEILDIDFLSFRSKRNLAQKIVRNNLRSSFISYSYSVCNACGYGNKSVVFRAADKYKVPLILWGDSKQEKTIDMTIKAKKKLKSHQSKYKRLLNFYFYVSEFYSLLHRHEFKVPGNSILKRGTPKLKNNDIIQIHVFDYIQWDRKEIKETIINKLGWKKSPNSKSTWRIDCKLYPLINYCYFKIFGCSKTCFGYCNMINDGQMDRKDALIQEEEIITKIIKKENIKKLLEDEIGLSKKEISKILSIEIEK